MDDSFKRVPLNVPKLSGFDKSHQNLLTTKCGTITPILIDELIPGSKVNLNLALSATLPPLASDTFMRCSVKVEAFFVPFRLLCGSFESWFTDEEKQFAPYVSSGNTITPTPRKGLLPILGPVTDANELSAILALVGRGSLMDYLGFKAAPNGTILNSNQWSLMPCLAYHKIYNDWYRNSLIQRELFLPPNISTANAPTAGAATIIATAPFAFYYEGSNNINSGVFKDLPSLMLGDGKFVLELRQRNFGLDYFTTATPSPQQGAASTVTFSTSGNTGNFSIAALRAANSLQQFKERNNIAGNLYVEQLYARYGVRPSDGVAQRALYLGSADFEIYSKGVYQTSTDLTGLGQVTQNPFNSVGAEYGKGTASGRSGLVSSFEAKEPGYLFVNATLVPRVSYSTGIHRRFAHYVGPGSLSDLANPILQNVGPQPINTFELNGVPSSTPFGYTDRYAEFKTMEDELHGLVVDGQTLEAFALQRSFSQNNSYQINSQFLEIPTDYMDQVTATAADISTYGCWMDVYFDYKVAQPLAKYSLPTLQDPAYEHGKTVVVSRGGSKL